MRTYRQEDRECFSFSALYVYSAESKKAFLREEGGTRQGFPEANEMSFGGSLRSVTEGARVTLNLDILHCNAFSLSRLRRQLPPGGSLFLFIYDLSIFLTSTAFVDTNAKYGIPLSRYTVFLQNCPLGYDPKDLDFFICSDRHNIVCSKVNIMSAMPRCQYLQTINFMIY